MKVIFVHHSCFAVEICEKVLIFDWFAGENINGYTFTGQIPEYEPDTPIYVFASHKHKDHFDPNVLHWAEKYNNIQYIFSKDCKMSENFLKKHGFSPSVKEKILYVNTCGNYIADGLEIQTLRSTDAGAAFYVKTNNTAFFHAGDLNNWKWDGAGSLVNGKMEFEFKTQLKKLESKQIDIAFIPLDPRLGENQFLGIDYFMQHTNARYVFPMHMWQDYSGIEMYLKRLTNKAAAERIMQIHHENEEFDFYDQ